MLSLSRPLTRDSHEDDAQRESDDGRVERQLLKVRGARRVRVPSIVVADNCHCSPLCSAWLRNLYGTDSVCVPMRAEVSAGSR